MFIDFEILPQITSFEKQKRRSTTVVENARKYEK